LSMHLKSAVTIIIIMVVLCCSVGFVSGFSTKNSVAGWYITLNQPPLNPPSWIFGIVWPILYILMGIAAGLVWNKGWADPNVRTALICFGIQLLLNGLWSTLFFGLHRIDWAMIEILLLWIMILVTTVLFYRASRPAGLLLLPYPAWVIFAVYLNAGFWFLNK